MDSSLFTDKEARKFSLQDDHADTKFALRTSSNSSSEDGFSKTAQPNATHAGEADRNQQSVHAGFGSNRVSLYRLAEQTMLNGIAGDCVEIGVHRGGSAAILAGLLKECDPTGHRTLSVRPMGRSTGHDGGMAFGQNSMLARTFRTNLPN
ncbi:TylF/MycF/NovP-related O-methyltransferase [Qipengyuania sp. YIM B01966]|uniref:TylF/MycF/NovP-related O-methyltransferase n=1 Tax=Qipengyuania sp. YIM B01966 TaxID=2778646 RepID=UPI0018F4FD95|nr:TylF/MycF/NovP-related O-methyltransferase [Qipengyuania sp. YIM B01966]